MVSFTKNQPCTSVGCTQCAYRLQDQFGRKEASVLVQLRTGMARLNDYLYRIQAALSDLCACGRARETVEHFLFTCSKWTEQRKMMLECTMMQNGNISYHLGGKTRSDKHDWEPDTRAVRPTIEFAIASLVGPILHRCLCYFAAT